MLFFLRDGQEPELCLKTKSIEIAQILAKISELKIGVPLSPSTVILSIRMRRLHTILLKCIHQALFCSPDHRKYSRIDNPPQDK